jgi:hypothetical protein
MFWQNARVLPEVTVAGLTEPLQQQPELIQHLYTPEAERGPSKAAAFNSLAPSFFTGVYLVDLRLSTVAGKVGEAQDILRFLYAELDQVPFGHTEAVSLKEAADGMTDSAALSRFAQTLPQREAKLQNWFAEDPIFRFGLWTEAGRLSAVTRSPKFFEQRANRRFLAAIAREIRSEDDEQRYGPILDDLQKIEPLWDRDERSAGDYEDLAGHFKSIIDQMERIQKEDQEDDLSSD